MTDDRKKLGDRGEDAAAAYLERAGMTVVERNWRCPVGEIDIVALEESTIVLCEVKTRRTSKKGTPEDAVTPAKQRRYARLAAAYIQHAGVGDVSIRFDVISLLVVARGPRALASPSRRVRTGRTTVTTLLCTVRTATLVGVSAVPVEVEVDVGSGLPSFSIVGLADLAVLEARERVRSALRASGFELPNARIVVNLAPGPLRKHGTGFDLPIAIGILVATRQLSAGVADEVVAVGELSLDGRVRPIAGMLAHALSAHEAGRALLGPAMSTAAVTITGVRYLPLDRLAELRGGLPQPAHSDNAYRHDADRCYAGLRRCHRTGNRHPRSGHRCCRRPQRPSCRPTRFGQDHACAATPHHPAATLGSRAARDRSRFTRSPASTSRAALDGVRPFRAPHHSATVAGLVGGGSPPRAGEASLAHNGVLFLDEMPQFAPSALQCLRQPLEDGVLTLVRLQGRVTFPARFALIGAANPCPCGFLGDPDRQCRCPPAHRRTLRQSHRRSLDGSHRPSRRGPASESGATAGLDPTRPQLERAARGRNLRTGVLDASAWRPDTDACRLSPDRSMSP